jgi:hypothetical protein
MSLFLANNPRNTKIDRQLWAHYTFRSLVGYIRFCPARPPPKKQHHSFDSFGKACVLKEGVWAGPGPRGQQKWNLRMRGLDIDFGYVTSYSEGFQSEISFSQGNDGRLEMTDIVIFEDQLMDFTATKVE